MLMCVGELKMAAILYWARKTETVSNLCVRYLHGTWKHSSELQPGRVNCFERDTQLPGLKLPKCSKDFQLHGIEVTLETIGGSLPL